MRSARRAGTPLQQQQEYTRALQQIYEAMADAKESPGKALREDVQAKQQALDEAMAALDKYEADKAAAATDAADDDDDALQIGALTFGSGDANDGRSAPRHAAARQRGDGDELAAAHARAEALTTPGAGWALPEKRPVAARQFEQLRRVHFEEDETGIILEVYLARKLGLEMDGRSMLRPFKTWADSDARYYEMQLRKRALAALSAVLLKRDQCSAARAWSTATTSYSRAPGAATRYSARRRFARPV